MMNEVARLGWNPRGIVLAAAAAGCVMVTGTLSHSEGTTVQGGRSIWDGVYTDAQAARGAAVYADACSQCHGSGLEGGEMEPPLTGGEFMYAWDGLTVADLFERVRVSMPPANPNGVNRQGKADIIGYLLSVNGVSPGTTELSRRTADLRAISFDAVQP